MAKLSTSTENLHLRVTPEAKSALQASAIAHRSGREFVLEGALSRADEDLAGSRTFGLNATQWKAFMDALMHRRALYPVSHES